MVDADLAIEYDIVDFESLTVTSSALKALTATKVQPTGNKKRRGVVCYVESGQIRFRNDPSATSLTSAEGANAGPSLSAGSVFTVQGSNNLSNLNMIATSGDSVVKVSYY